MEDFSTLLRNSLNGQRIKFCLRRENITEWQKILNSVSYHSLENSDNWIDYQNKCKLNYSTKVYDVSFTFYSSNGVALGRIPLYVTQHSDGLSLDSSGYGITSPVFVDGVSKRDAKAISSRLLSALLEFGSCLNLKKVLFNISPGAMAYNEFSLSPWMQALMRRGCLISLRSGIVVNLQDNLSDIRSDLRKSYRPLINHGLKIWRSKIFDAGNISDSVWASFKELHLQAAGRQTRSNDTWLIQKRIISAGEANLICLFDENSEQMVGGAYFQHTKDEANYVSAAYNRALFDEPLGHVVQWLAITHLKELGLKHYWVGEEVDFSQETSFSQKEKSISFFKQGFSNISYPRYLASYEF